MRPSLVLTVLLAVISPCSLVAQTEQPKQMVSEESSRAIFSFAPVKEKTAEELASEKSMQVLDVASKVVDTASGFVSYSGLFLAGFAIAITLVSVVVQGIGVLLKNRAAKKAVDNVLEQLASDEEFATRVIQEIMKKPELGEYLVAQAEVVVRDRAHNILTKDYFESKMSELSLRWQQAATAQTNNLSSSGSDNGV